MTHLKQVVLGIFCLVALSSCNTYPDKDNIVNSQLVSLTQFNTKKDFTQYKTFLVSDSMCVLASDGKSTTMVKNKISEILRNQSIQCMTAYGYTQAMKEVKPDLIINLSGVENTNVSYSFLPWGFYNPYYWGYWGDWGDYYYDWDYYYPYYPMLTSAYTTGSALIEMLDLKNTTIDSNKKQIETIWVGIIRGIMDYNHSSSEITNAINLCFSQTNTPPFINTKR
ncbi:MAG: DUF4136 domain-containing protein [Bacteroidales bacterium]